MAAARAVEEEALRRFENRARATQDRLAGAIKSYTDATRALAALFASSDGPVTRLQFHRYVDNLALRTNYPANGMAWKAHFNAPKSALLLPLDHRLPLIAMAAGFAATLLFYSLFLSLYWSRRAAIEQRALLDTVLDNLDAFVFMKDRDRRFRDVNAKTALALGEPGRGRRRAGRQ